MKQNITFNQFCDRFRDMSRDTQFSYEGKKALYDYLIRLEEDIGQEMDLDVVALCVEFTEYEDMQEFIRDSGYASIESMEDLEDNTTVIKISGTDGFIIQDF